MQDVRDSVLPKSIDHSRFLGLDGLERWDLSCTSVIEGSSAGHGLRNLDGLAEQAAGESNGGASEPKIQHGRYPYPAQDVIEMDGIGQC